MQVVVCVKQIPDTASLSSLDPETHNMVRPEDQILDDTDRYGLEVGLQIAEQTEGSVTIISMGPTGSMQGVRQALAMGADKAVLIDDTSLEGSDALTTAKVLSAAATREGFDVVIAGVESTDGYSGVLPQMMSELLDVPALTFARKVELEGNSVKIERQTSAGFDVVQADLPAVLAVTAGVVEPRYPTFKSIMAAKSKPVDTLTAADLSVESNPRQEISSVVPAPAREGGKVIEDEGEAHLAIIEALEEAKVI